MNGTSGFNRAEYETEARERWGETEAYRESSRRARSYRAEDWARIHREADDVLADLAELMRSGVDPTSPEAMEAAERHRRHIDRWFYPCSVEMHAGLADMYTMDERFGAYFEARGEGLTSYVAEAIRASARRATGETSD